MQHQGNWSCVNWWEVGGSAIVGAVGGQFLDALATAASLSAELGSFSAAELEVIAEAQGILDSAGFGELAASSEAGESMAVNIGGRLIQFEPGMSASGMTMFGENGFLMGREAFSSGAEAAKTVLHELYRLSFSESSGGLSGGMAFQETQAAANFAMRAINLLTL